MIMLVPMIILVIGVKSKGMSILAEHCCWTSRTGWNSGKYHAPNTLIQAPEQDIALHGTRSRILEDALIVRRLDACLEGVKRIDDEINGDCGEGASL